MKGILVAALLAALAGGAWWWLGGRNDTIPLSVPSAPRPIPPRAGLTDADVAEIAVEASVQKSRVERIDDADGFKARKLALDDGLNRATANRKEKLWAEAAQEFTNYVNGCKALVALEAERQTAKKSKVDAEAAKARASEAEASQYAETRWKEANRFLEEANNLFGDMTFAAAATKYAAAAKQFDLCVGDANAERKRQEDEAAAKAKAEKEKREREAAEVKAKAEREAEEISQQTAAESRKCATESATVQSVRQQEGLKVTGIITEDNRIGVPMVRAATPIAYGGDNPWQIKRHEEKMKLVSAGGAKVVFIGDSITHFWETIGRKYFSTGEYRMLNLGFAGDRTENVLWRIDNGELDGYEAKCVVLLIGTNNTGHFPIEKESPEDTILGIKTILNRIREKQPTAIIVVTAILPRGASPKETLRQRNDIVNRGIQRFCDGKTVLWCDFGKSLLDEKGDTKWVMPDRLHLNAKGFEIWYEKVRPYIDYALCGGLPPVNADDTVAGITKSAVIKADSFLGKKVIVKDSDTTYLRNAIMPFVQNGSLPGAIGVLYKNGYQETACMGWADVRKRLPMSLDRTFMICSQSKGFCGVCIAMLIEEGRINLDDPVSRYLPQFVNMIVEVKDGNSVRRVTAQNEITIRHLLTHCAGFPFDVPSVLEKGWTSCPISQVVAEAAANPLVAEPGTKIQYSNVGFAIAAAIIEKLSGQRYDEFLEKRIFYPLGMRDTTFNPTDEQLSRQISMYTISKNSTPMYTPENKRMPLPHNGPTVYAYPAMGLWSTADDLLKFYQMIMLKGVGANGVRLLQEQTVLELLATSQRPPSLQGYYSLGFSILQDDESRWLGHGGAWGTYFKINIDKQELFLWVVQLCGAPRPWDAVREEAAKSFFRNVP